MVSVKRKKYLPQISCHSLLLHPHILSDKKSVPMKSHGIDRLNRLLCKSWSQKLK